MGTSINSKATGAEKMEKTGMYPGKEYKDLSASQQYAVDIEFDKLTSTQAKEEDKITDEQKVEKAERHQQQFDSAKGDPAVAYTGGEHDAQSESPESDVSGTDQPAQSEEVEDGNGD